MKNYDREAVTYYDFIGAGTVGTDTSFDKEGLAYAEIGNKS